MNYGVLYKYLIATVNRVNEDNGHESSLIFLHKNW